MPKRKNPETSIEAHKSLRKEQLRKTYHDILLALALIKEGTFEDIAKQMRVEDSVVWKRLSELHEAKLIYRPGNKRPLKSGRRGYTWMLVVDGVAPTSVTEKMLAGKSISEYSKEIMRGYKQSELFS